MIRMNTAQATELDFENAAKLTKAMKNWSQPNIFLELAMALRSNENLQRKIADQRELLRKYSAQNVKPEVTLTETQRMLKRAGLT